MELRKVNLDEKFELIKEYESPRIVGELNGQHVKLSKLKGEFVWHQHEQEDEMFFVHRGRLRSCMRSGDVMINAGEFFIVPRGVEHNPVAEGECWIMLFEPAGTVNTGDKTNEKTKQQLDWI